MTDTVQDFLFAAQQAGELQLFDIQFAKAIVEVNGEHVPELSLAAALASNRLGCGDTCVALDRVDEFGLYQNSELEVIMEPPPLAVWRERLLAQSVVGEPGTIAPLILDTENRLYLGRYWAHEQSLLQSLRSLVSSSPPSIDSDQLKSDLKKLFASSVDGITATHAPDNPESKPNGTINTREAEVDWQCVAAASALVNRLCVITGGPGTGKTYTVAAILQLLQHQRFQGKLPRVALAAPTGKAAARLTESVRGAFNAMPASDYAQIEAVTLHRLLGSRPGRITPFYNSKNPMPYDMLIVDEASMVDLPLMAKTFAALADDARIVLLGDKDQLASVESGMVLGDICGNSQQVTLSTAARDRLQQFSGLVLPASSRPAGTIADHIVFLGKSYRSAETTGINALAAAVNTGDVEGSLQYLRGSQHPNLRLLSHNAASIEATLRESVIPVYENITAHPTPSKSLAAMNRVCVLCALKRGKDGAEGINRLVQRILSRAGHIDRQADNEFYPGRPVMVTENNHVQNLFNGDHGLVLRDSESGEDRVFFSSEAGPRAMAPGRLPSNQTFYAMTIHKSQGSEYDTVVIVLPETENAILSRELLYTAITRARHEVVIIANENVLRAAISSKAVRQSGLLDTLWPKPLEKTNTVAEKRSVSDVVPFQTSLEF